MIYVHSLEWISRLYISLWICMIVWPSFACVTIHTLAHVTLYILIESSPLKISDRFDLFPDVRPSRSYSSDVGSLVAEALEWPSKLMMPNIQTWRPTLNIEAIFYLDPLCHRVQSGCKSLPHLSIVWRRPQLRAVLRLPHTLDSHLLHNIFLQYLRMTTSSHGRDDDPSRFEYPIYVTQDQQLLRPNSVIRSRRFWSDSFNAHSSLCKATLDLRSALWFQSRFTCRIHGLAKIIVFPWPCDAETAILGFHNQFHRIYLIIKFESPNIMTRFLLWSARKIITKTQFSILRFVYRQIRSEFRSSRYDRPFWQFSDDRAVCAAFPLQSSCSIETDTRWF